MISRPTTIVLGAGASVPFGFPSGRQLVDRLCSPGIGHRLITAGFPERMVREFQTSLARSATASIDSFLENQPTYRELGKLGIAEVLVPCEVPDLLWKRTETHLYEYLLQQLQCPVADFVRNRLSVITFNYDRSFDVYLTEALRHRYALAHKDAVELASAIETIHVHGQLGSLNERAYEPSHALTQLAAQGLRIIHEDVTGSAAFVRARQLLRESERLVFLGFGYHPVNLERLAIQDRSAGYRTFGTAYGLTELEKGRIVQRFGGRITLGESDHDCVSFLRNRILLDD